jgi:hypothetical protein
MEGFLGGLVGAVGDVFGGLMNTSSAQAINSANLAQQMFLARNKVSLTVADAKRAGINPLSALGVSSPGFVGATPTDPGAGVAAAGQDIARALEANKDKASKLDDLSRAEMQSRIDENDANTAYIRSKTIRALTDPGTGPGVPLPRSDPRFTSNILPAMQRFQTTSGVVAQPSRSYTESSFSALPGISGTPGVASDIAEQNLPAGGTSLQLPPSVARALQDYSSVYGVSP